MTSYDQSEPARRGSYMGESDEQLKQWASHFADTVDANFAALGLTAGDAIAIRAVTDQYVAAYVLTTQPTTNSKSATIAKNSERAELERVCRPLAMQIKANPHVSNNLKFAVGVHLDDAHRTPIRSPRTRPVLSVREVSWTGFMLRFRDSGLVESRGKPKGAIGMLLGADFSTENGFNEGRRSVHHVALLTRSPHRVNFPPEVMDGKAARYYGCWITAKGKQGQWSSPLLVPTYARNVGSAVVETQPATDALKLAG